MVKTTEKIMKIPVKVFGIAFIVFLILSGVAYGFSSYIEKIEVGSISEWYHTITDIFPCVLEIANFKGKWIFLLLTIFSGILLVVRLLYRKKIFVINHCTMAYDMAKLDKSVNSRYRIKEHILQQTNKIKPDTLDNAAIKEIDELAIDAQKSNMPIAYYGIAHTPLIFRMGFKIGDQNNTILLHKRRKNNSLFEEWGNGRSGIKLIPREENKSKKSDELVVAISTSLEIKKEHLNLLQPDDKHILYLKANELGFDNILTYEDAEDLRSDILLNLRNMVSKYKIKKIHMVISSSVAFTFFLAQGYSGQHDPEVIVYHYEHGEYPWGIAINKDVDEAYIRLKK